MNAARDLEIIVVFVFENALLGRFLRGLFSHLPHGGFFLQGFGFGVLSHYDTDLFSVPPKPPQGGPPSAGLLSSPPSDPELLPGWGIGLICGGGGLMLMLVALFVSVIFHYRRQTGKLKATLSKKLTPLAKMSTFAQRVQKQMARPIPLEEIVAVTRNFSEDMLLGTGGYGAVYRGECPNGEVWAVKKSKDESKKNLSHFQQEVGILSQVSHFHIVKLVGFCDEGDEQILVYEFMAGGNLHQRLHPEPSVPPLSFSQRLRIASGIADALLYLHTYSQLTIIHRDVKSENILLDEDLQAKLSDFGLLKMNGLLSHVSTQAFGTPGYIDPEYYYTSKLTFKSDVYSFGVVLLELVSGRKPVMKLDSEHSSDSITIVHWAVPIVERGNKIDLVDRQLDSQYPHEPMESLIDLAIACVQKKSSNRPDMASVARRLGELLGPIGTARQATPKHSEFWSPTRCASTGGTLPTIQSPIHVNRTEAEVDAKRSLEDDLNEINMESGWFSSGFQTATKDSCES
eukprot:TRINITY_DN1509_c0_g1_i2.p1 TRINITY_DN1509_c0_g1~~TRINITY_DN1509_c0_g1_i2.p1  ORF type:complete len:528 (-),score=63.89 TRINITY_DN1509_c0_g1_i2:692-2233(-)